MASYQPAYPPPVDLPPMVLTSVSFFPAVPMGDGLSACAGPQPPNPCGFPVLLHPPPQLSFLNVGGSISPALPSPIDFSRAR